MTSIAIVGMGCRFPGAADLVAYWDLIRTGRVATGPVAASRWQHERFFTPDDPRNEDTAYTDQVAHLDDVRSFGASHYGLPPRRVEVTDPQYRLLVELTRAALQDAGMERGGWPRERTGVYIGASTSEYQDLLMTRVRARQLAAGEFGPVGDDDRDRLAGSAGSVTPMRAYTIAGTALNMAAATVSSVFDLGGPSFTVDAACSSALVAVHEAVSHLRAGQCDLALAGGVYLNLVPDALIGFCRIGAVSRSGTCRPFDRRADGFVLGEGAGVVVLKRLADAVRDGDRVYAVVRGGACTNDGRAEGPMTPRQDRQVACLEKAYADAGVGTGSVGYLECHGTATPTGDAVELAALRHAWRDQPVTAACFLSSVKANIGHTMAAAGIASLIKATLVVQSGLVPPQPGCEQVDPALAGDGRFVVPQVSTPWPAPAGGVRRAGVSAFGFGGTNAHLVLEQAPPRPPVPPGQRDGARRFLLTAASPPLLAGYATRLAGMLAGPDRPALADLARTLATRAPLATRVSVVASSHDELGARLHALAGALAAGGPLPEGLDRDPPPGEPVAGGGLVTLPPTPIATAPYWGVAPPTPAAPVPDAIVGPLFTAAAAASGFPVEQLRLDQTFAGDLGFDSLMFAEFALYLQEARPEAPAPPEELFTTASTLGEVAAWLAGAAAAVPASAPPQPGPDPHPPPDQTAAFTAQLAALGLTNPYFTVHEGVLGAATAVDGEALVSFSGYDYLGLAGDPAVTAAAKQAIDRYGTSVSASRIVSGERPVHGALEAALARLLGAEQALTFVSGYATNVSVLSHLLGAGDLILHDELAHSSIVQGAVLSGAARRAFAHNDLPALDRRLRDLRGRYRRVLVAVEGVYSMDGDLADLPALVELRRRHDVLLYVDEAHSAGVLGATGGGACQHWQVDPAEVDLRMGTLSKALASCGGFIAGTAPMVTHLRHTAPGSVYSVGMPPPVAAAALAALQRLAAEPERAAAARAGAHRFRDLAREAGLDTGRSTAPSAIVPVVVGDPARALVLADHMRRQGVHVAPILPPAVAPDQARLRFFLTAQHTEQDIAAAIDALAAGVRFPAPEPAAAGR